MVRIFCKDCGDKKITVNAVAPGGTVTNMFHDFSHHYIPNGSKLTAEERQEMAAHASPLHRNGFPDDVAKVVGFLVSNEGITPNGRNPTQLLSLQLLFRDMTRGTIIAAVGQPEHA